jgi:hypothetical protein
MATTSQYDPGEGFGGGGANRATDHQSLRQCNLDQVLRVVTFSLSGALVTSHPLTLYGRGSPLVDLTLGLG